MSTTLNELQNLRDEVYNLNRRSELTYTAQRALVARVNDAIDSLISQKTEVEYVRA